VRGEGGRPRDAHRGEKFHHLTLEMPVTPALPFEESEVHRGARVTRPADYITPTQLAAEEHDTPHAILVSRVLPAPKTGMCIMRNVIIVAPVIAVHVASVGNRQEGRLYAGAVLQRAGWPTSTSGLRRTDD
jgi:hypothetical protein